MLNIQHRVSHTRSNTRSINHLANIDTNTPYATKLVTYTARTTCQYFPANTFPLTLSRQHESSKAMKKKSLNVYHLSATENTLRKMPKFNPYQTGHGVIGDTKYNRRKTKRELRKLIDES